MFNFFKNIFKNNKKDTIDIPSLKSEIKEEIKEEIKNEIQKKVRKEIFNEMEHKYKDTTTIENKTDICSQHNANIETTFKKDNVLNIEAYRNVKRRNTLICPECNKKLTGHKSAKSNNVYYMICDNCSFVSKIQNETAFKPPNTLNEINTAYKLFKEEGINPSKYSFYKDSEKIEF